jgi:hypothetical protein
MKALPSHRLRLFRSDAVRPPLARSLGDLRWGWLVWVPRGVQALERLSLLVIPASLECCFGPRGPHQRGGAVGTIGACSLWEHVLSDNHLGVMKGPGNGQDITLKEGGS